MSAQRPEAAWLTSRPIAHRGLHDISKGIPENSLVAFERASRHGFPVEFDAQLTRDGNVVVIHDRNLQRMTGMDAAVVATDYEAITKLRLRDTDQSVPTLVEVLDLIKGAIPIVIEIKNFGSANTLEDKVLELLQTHDQEVAVVSFNPRSLKYFRRIAPEIPRGQNSGLFRTADLDGVKLNQITRLLLRFMLLNALSRPDFICYQLAGITSLPVTIRRRFGTPILTWTVKSRQDQASARPHVDNFFFEGFIPDVTAS
jgi:glycerophosphoryl diester phosphodiesterase